MGRGRDAETHQLALREVGCALPAILILSTGVEIRPVIPAGKPESSVHGWQLRFTASLIVSLELHVPRIAVRGRLCDWIPAS